MRVKQRYTARDTPAHGDGEIAERQPFIDAVAAQNPMMTQDFLALGGEETFTAMPAIRWRGPNKIGPPQYLFGVPVACRDF